MKALTRILAAALILSTVCAAAFSCTKMNPKPTDEPTSEEAVLQQESEAAEETAEKADEPVPEEDTAKDTTEEKTPDEKKTDVSDSESDEYVCDMYLGDFMDSSEIGEIGNYLDIDEWKGIKISLSLSLNPDKTFKIAFDEKDVDALIESIKKIYGSAALKYFKEQIEQSGITEEDFLSALGDEKYASLEEYINTVITDESIETVKQSFTETDFEGTYTDTKLIPNDGNTEQADYSIDGDTLTIKEGEDTIVFKRK